MVVFDAVTASPGALKPGRALFRVRVGCTRPSCALHTRAAYWQARDDGACGFQRIARSPVAVMSLIAVGIVAALRPANTVFRAVVCLYPVCFLVRALVHLAARPSAAGCSRVCQ